jgi:hypothetical protein
MGEPARQHREIERAASRLPAALTPQQHAAIMEGAKALPRRLRRDYLAAVGLELTGKTLGPGMIFRAIRTAQRQCACSLGLSCEG